LIEKIEDHGSQWPGATTLLSASLQFDKFSQGFSLFIFYSDPHDQFFKKDKIELSFYSSYIDRRNQPPLSNKNIFIIDFGLLLQISQL
jgi:hypothetical protein